MSETISGGEEHRRVGKAKRAHVCFEIAATSAWARREVAPLPTLQCLRPHASHRSREAWSSEACCLPHPEMRGRSAERRFGCLRGTRSRASDVGPQALARRLTSHDAGRPPLGAPPRQFLASDCASDTRAGPVSETLSTGGLHPLALGVLPNQGRPLIMGADSDPRPPGSWLRAKPAGAASRSASSSSPETPSVIGMTGA